MTDLVIRDALLVDGTGSPGRPADISIADGVISAVDEPGAGTTAHTSQVIDAQGRLVTPGFVDIHTHYDAQVTWDPLVTPSSWHGVTTVVMGNCGVGFAPADPERHEWLIDLMEGVEDIPGSAMTEGITWDWTTFPEYLDSVASMPRMVDVGAQIGHGPLRAYVMGERGAANEPANADDMASMARLVAEALRAGALGFSTSRTPIHRSAAGELVPGTTASADELLAIGDAMAQVGHGVFQFAPDHARLPVEEWPWMVELARRSGRTISVNVNQPDSDPDVWRDVAGLLDDAAAEGLSIYAQVAGRSIGVLATLQGSIHPLLFHPAYTEVATLPLDARVAALAEPERRRRLIEDIPDDQGLFERVVLDKLHRMWPVQGADIDYEPDESTSFAALATRLGVPAMQLVVDQLTSDGGRGMIYTPFFNYAYGDLSMTHELLQHDRTRNGLSDAGAHCGAICDGGMPTFMLTHWARDRHRGPRLPLECVVRRQTRDTAALYGLADRGIVAPGMRADVNIIDFEHLGFDVPRMAFDLPANGRRLVQHGKGYVATFVAGVQTVADDEPTGERPGKLIRGPQQAPA